MGITIKSNLKYNDHLNDRSNPHRVTDIQLLDPNGYIYTFPCPNDSDNDYLHFEIQISDVKDFSNIIESKNSNEDITGWKVFNGNYFEDITSDGVPPGYVGKIISISFDGTNLSRGKEYFIRVSSYDGSKWSDYRGDTIIW